MAKLIALLFLLSCIFAVQLTTHATKKSSWFQNICSETHEKVVNVHFYEQVMLGGLNPMAYEVARATITSNSTTRFSQVWALDFPLTAEPDYDSLIVGRAQGLVTYADLETQALAMNVNFYFTWGKYNGSTISILGRNQVGNRKRELSVVGGTGVFRGARGYAITSTYSYDAAMSYIVLEYTLYVTYVDDSKRVYRRSRERELSCHAWLCI